MGTPSRSLELIIEALLFASDRPISERDIASWLQDARLPEIRAALARLKDRYEEMNRSFTLREVGRGFQFRTRPGYAPYVLTMFKASPSRLSRAALETLAIVAYKQPVLRQEIERLRGVDVGGILRSLMEKGLVKIMGRKNLPGRPLIYGTTRKFLEVFDLKDLDSLPRLKEISELGSDEEQGTPTKTETRPADEEPGPGTGEQGPAEGGAAPGTPSLVPPAGP